MPPDAPSPEVATPHRLPALALAAWVVVVLAICGRVLLASKPHGVYPIFAHAGAGWLAGEDLYSAPAPESGLDQFRYSPAVAALLAPFSLLPDRVGGSLWRLLNAAVYLAAFAWWCAAVVPGGTRLTAARRAALWLLLVPLSVGSLNNGQSNPLVMGLLLAAVAGVARRRWNLAAACVAVAFLFKGYPLAVGLLLAAVYPRQFAPRLALALTAGLALPFLLQRPAYVLGEYEQWLRLVGGDDRKDRPVVNAYRDLWLLFRVAGVPPGKQAYLALQLLTAAGAAALCVAGRVACWPRRRLLTALLSLGVCWMLLCGPATESATYLMLAPVLAWAVVEGCSAGATWRSRWLPLASFGVLTLAQAAVWFPVGKPLHALGVQPLAALVLTAGLVADYLGRLSEGGRAARVLCPGP